MLDSLKELPDISQEANNTTDIQAQENKQTLLRIKHFVLLLLLLLLVVVVVLVVVVAAAAGRQYYGSAS